MELETKDLLLNLVIVLLVFLAGFLTAIAIEESTNVHGFYVRNWNVSAIEQLVELESSNTIDYPDNYRGQWVCVDLRDITSPKRQMEICNHEVGHHYYRENCGNKCEGEEGEDFAEQWEKDVTKCIIEL